METYLGIDWEEVRNTEELLAGRMDQLARKKEVLELGYKRMMEARAKSVWYWDSRMAHRLRGPLVPGDMVLAYNKSLEDQWWKLFHNWWNGPYRVVEQAPGKSYAKPLEKKGEEEKDGGLGEVVQARGGHLIQVGPEGVNQFDPADLFNWPVAEEVKREGAVPAAVRHCPRACPPGVMVEEENRGHTEDGYGWSGKMAWRGDRWQWCKEEAGGGCGGRNGKGGQGKGGAERGFVGFFLDFEEEGVAGEENRWRHWKEGQKLGGGAHQGRIGWSKTTGATDL
ncbi:hypothetical protein BY996DRAFT_6502227 [Phakopsora pachyrhizi]|nr:hypothetical protein BY996DRAFT_6502227 [Phakopsora pachyrhizi]